MAGIYIHIPFCRQACHYCDFHFSTSLRSKDAFLEALLKEIELRSDYLQGSPVHTVYFGGGTPSLLGTDEISRIVEAIGVGHSISSDAEITLEANPDDLTSEKLHGLAASPVNRLSIGIQSFHEADLKFMNRAHNAEEAFSSVKRARDAGFENISIDLIYGTPTMNDAQWLHNLEQAFSLRPEHISCYCLTVEPGTALDSFVRKGKAPAVDEELAAAQFRILLQQMTAQGYEQYEISNFCRDGFYSRHNSSYWLGEHYMGLGPSAHSCNGSSRQWNVASNPRYIASIGEGIVPCETEILTPLQRFNEYVMISLRTSRGCSLDYIDREFAGFAEEFRRQAQKFIPGNLLIQRENSLLLSEEGKLLADRITSDLFAG
jgi:oxygen-independent coproporphyrinogen III oxidase